MTRSHGASPSKRYLRLGEYIPPPDQRVQLDDFRGPGGIGFDQVVTLLQNGNHAVTVAVYTAGHTTHGVAFEVDDSNIIRIGQPDQPSKPGVRILVSRHGGRLYGEFAD